jgi:hypothetical protein
MTPREIDLLQKAFEAFLGGNRDGERFLLTNRSMEGFIVYYARFLREKPSDEGRLTHVIEHAAQERERLLAEARDRGDEVFFNGRKMTVLTEDSANRLERRKPAPPNHSGM